MDTDWPVVTRELLIGAIVIVAGLVIVFARHRSAKSRRKEEKEDREKSERVEALTAGINDPKALKQTLDMRDLISMKKIKVSPELKPGPRTWLLYLLLIIMVGIVVGIILVIR